MPGSVEQHSLFQPWPGRQRLLHMLSIPASLEISCGDPSSASCTSVSKSASGVLSAVDTFFLDGSGPFSQRFLFFQLASVFVKYFRALRIMVDPTWSIPLLFFQSVLWQSE